MTLRLSSSCFGAVSSARPSWRSHRPVVVLSSQANRIVCHRYATQPPKQPQNDEPPPPEKTALVAVQRHRQADPINPPRSTLPAPLDLPTRGPENALTYYYRLGRAYGRFYLIGIKAVWFNYQASRIIKDRIKNEAGANGGKLGLLTRSEFQILERNSHDIGKLPFFGALALVVGEWLPLFVPFMPGIVPFTCQIPKQLEGLRRTAEERRRQSFRQGISPPSEEQMQQTQRTLSTESNNAPWSATQRAYTASLLTHLRDDQMHHLSCTLNLHSRLWDRIQLSPPSFLLRRALAKRLAYLTSDDRLLNRYGGAPKLSHDELQIACEERGLDVVGIRPETLQSHLSWWLARQEEDKGAGRAVLAMLFKRFAIRDWVRLNLQANRSA